MKILLSGASGFVGSALLKSLGAHSVTVIGRTPIAHCHSFYEKKINGDEFYQDSLQGIDVVVHTAALAHVTPKDGVTITSAYREVNVEGTLNLARQAAAAGVKRFVFISSIGVHGNKNSVPFTEEDQPNPVEQYAQSKWEAENGLWQVQRDTGIEIVIIRPPLVYGPNAPGNFGSLMCWVAKGIPLPLGAIHNQRTLVAVDNLVDLILTCIVHRAASNQVFLAGDGQDLSTTELLRGVAEAMGKPSRLIPVPTFLLIFGAKLLGKKAVAQKLLGSLRVDTSKARVLLGWEPPVSVEEGLTRCFSKEK